MEAEWPTVATTHSGSLNDRGGRCVNHRAGCERLGAPLAVDFAERPLPASSIPLRVASANEIPSLPPASASVPVIVTCALPGTAAFSGDSGCRKPV